MPRNAVSLAALTAVVVLVLDQATKVLVRGAIDSGEQRTVISGVLDLVHVENDGVAFGRLAGSGALVALVVAAALLALIFYFATHVLTPLAWLPTGLLLGGSLGNIIDRVASGSVTDYVKFPHWPAFNLADACITVGVVALVLVVERDERRRQRTPRTESADGAASQR